MTMPFSTLIPAPAVPRGAVLALAVAATCAAATGLRASEPVTVIETGAIPPADAAFWDPANLERAVTALPGVVDDILARSGIPGVAVALVADGEVTVYAAGLRDLSLPADDPANQVDAETVFQIASVSKSVSATVAARAVAEGIADWDDPVSAYLAEFALSDPYVARHATIGDFFAHRSGLPGAAGDELEDLGFARSEIIARLALQPLDAFRDSYHYANFGTTIAAEAVAAAAGTGWEDLADRLLFEPLGMTRTSYRNADFLGHENRAVLHALRDGSFVHTLDRQPDQQAPAGGVTSTAPDLAKWLGLLLGTGDADALLPVPALLPAVTPQITTGRAPMLDARPGAYGFGFNVNTESGGRMSAGHSGAFVLGTGANFRIVPSIGFGVVALTNGAPVGAAEAIVAALTDIALYGAPVHDWLPLYQGLTAPYFLPEGDLAGAEAPADPAPARPLDSYAGTYGNAYYGPAEITVDGDALVLTLGPDGQSFRAAHWDGDVFAVPFYGENAPDGSLSTLSFDVTEGAATGFTVDYFDTTGLGSWTR